MRRHAAPLGVTVLWAALVAGFYYATTGLAVTPDSAGYLAAAGFDGIDASRPPGYPAFLAAVSLLPGPALVGASMAQGVLFVAAMAGMYAAGYLATGSRLAGTAVAATATLAVEMFYVRAVVVEAVALPLQVAVLVAACACVRRPSPARLWALGGTMLALAMTRPEWLLLPVPLLALLTVRAPRRTIVHAATVAATVTLVAAAYAAANYAANGVPGLTEVQRINLLGKAMQYDLDTGDPRVDRFAADNPYVLAAEHPAFRADHWRLAGSTATGAVLADPLTFASRTASLLWDLAGWLLVACAATVAVFAATGRAGMFAAAAAMTVYGHAAVAAGAYDSYGRLLAPLAPLEAFVVTGAAFAALSLAYRKVSRARLPAVAAVAPRS